LKRTLSTTVRNSLWTLGLEAFMPVMGQRGVQGGERSVPL
jgi:hypothetical protein